MELRFAEEERDLLLEILQEHRKKLIHEIARADHRGFKHELQNRCARIEGILGKVQAQQAVPAA